MLKNLIVESTALIFTDISAWVEKGKEWEA